MQNTIRAVMFDSLCASFGIELTGCDALAKKRVALYVSSRVWTWCMNLSRSNGASHKASLADHVLYWYLWR